MDSLGIELTAQIVESTQWLSESICVVREAIRTKKISKEALEALSCKGKWADLLIKDRKLIIENMPLLPIIQATNRSLEQIYREDGWDEYTRGGEFFLETADPDDAITLKTIGPALGRLGMMRYPHDTANFSIWQGVSLGDYVPLGSQQIVIEYALRLDLKGKAYYDITRIFLRALKKKEETKKNWNNESSLYFNSIG